MAVSKSPESTSEWDAFVPPGKGGSWPLGGSASFCIGFLSLCALAAVTCWWAIPHFENRLDRSVRLELADNGIEANDLNFDWSYRDVDVTGQLPQGLDEGQLLTLLHKTDERGIRRINLSVDPADNQSQELAQFGTVDVTMSLEEGVMLLQGSVLTDQQRSRLQLAAETAIGVAGVQNEIIVTGFSEKTPGSDQRVESLATSIEGLNQALSADARLSATDFRFNATVVDETQADDLIRLRGNAGDVGLIISGDIITKKSAPVDTIDVTAKKDNGRIIITGVVNNPVQQQRLLTAARNEFDEQSVVDELTVGDINPGSARAAQSISVLEAAISNFGEAIEAQARVFGDDFEFNALLEQEEDSPPLQAVAQQARGLGFSLTGEIKSRQMSVDKEVSMLQNEIDSISAEIRENVVFESGKADLDFTAKQTLDKIVDAMNRYQRSVVEIAGHTDDQGGAEANQRFSYFRATAVLEYLKLSGIDESRLSAVGYGESTPVASNSTEVGRQQNRRVDFTARRSF